MSVSKDMITFKGTSICLEGKKSSCPCSGKPFSIARQSSILGGPNNTSSVGDWDGESDGALVLGSLLLSMDGSDSGSNGEDPVVVVELLLSPPTAVVAADLLVFSFVLLLRKKKYATAAPIRMDTIAKSSKTHCLLYHGVSTCSTFSTFNSNKVSGFTGIGISLSS